MKMGLNGLHVAKIGSFIQIAILGYFFELTMNVWIVAYCYPVFFINKLCLLLVKKLFYNSSVRMDK